MSVNIGEQLRFTSCRNPDYEFIVFIDEIKVKRKRGKPPIVELHAELPDGQSIGPYICHSRSDATIPTPYGDVGIHVRSVGIDDERRPNTNLSIYAHNSFIWEFPNQRRD